MALRNKYLPLDLPFNQNPYGLDSGISALHDLYPGRPMTIFGRYYEYEIPNENPEGAKETFENNRNETHMYAAHLQKLALEQGGGDKSKVLVHAIDDPSSVIEEPDLQGNAVQTPLTQNNGSPFLVSPLVISDPEEDQTNDFSLKKEGSPFKSSSVDRVDQEERDVSAPYNKGNSQLVERFGPAGDNVRVENMKSEKTKPKDGRLNSLILIALILIILLVFTFLI